MPSPVPEYLKIRQYVFSLIAAADPDNGPARISTEEDLCAIHGVARGTVRKALKKLVDEGLLLRKPHLGTFINPDVIKRSNHRKAIGIIVGDGQSTFLDEYYMKQLEAVFRRLCAVGVQSRIIYFNYDAAREIEALCRSGINGVIWLAPGAELQPELDVLTESRIPAVSLFPNFRSDRYHMVYLDYFRYGYELTRRLLALGHRRIFFLEHAPEELVDDKKAGAMAAFREAGIKWENRFWFHEQSYKTVASLEKELSARLDFSAVVCTGASADMVRKKLAGHPEIRILYPACSPGGTDALSFSLPLAESGDLAANMVIDMMQKRVADQPPLRIKVDMQMNVFDRCHSQQYAITTNN